MNPFTPPSQNIPPIITVQNIVNIQIFYKIPSGGSKFDVASIIVNYQNGSQVQQQNISLNEILNYIKLLEQKGQGTNPVSATQSTPDGELYTIIGLERPDPSQFIKFVTTGLQFFFIIYPRSSTTGYFIQNDATFYLAKDTFYNYDTTEGFFGAINVEQFSNGVSKQRDINQAIFASTNVFDNTIDEIHIDSTPIAVTTAPGTFTQEIFITSSVTSRVNNNGGNNAFGKYDIGAVEWDLATNVAGGGNQFNVQIKRGGLILQSASGILLIGSIGINPGNEDFDEVFFEKAAIAPGAPFSVRWNSVLTGFCSTPPSTAYTATGTLAIGQIVYSDAALTTPLLGRQLIANVTDGHIYNLDPLTGTVLSLQGTSCVPASGFRSVFIVNQTASVVQIQTDGGIYNTPVGTSSANLLPGGFVTNLDAGGHTFGFYTSAPFNPGNLDPDEAPNPDVMGHFGTHTLNNDLANLNYIVIT